MPRIVIRRRDSGQILYEAEGTTLWGVSLAGRDLTRAAMYAIEMIDPPAPNAVAAISLRKANLSGADLSGANLAGAVFSEEVIVGVDFSNANLEAAVFVRAQLINCKLRGANLTRARLSSTAFINCSTLHQATGLDDIEHAGPSVLDQRTLRACVAKLPINTLLGMGYAEREITALRALYEREKKFYSCFISYARSDYEFADHLRRRLLKNNVSCWQDTHDMKGGIHWRGQIYDAIEKQEKLILICSRDSVTRPAVVAEITEAIERERAKGTQKLFPIRIDDYIFSDELETIARSRVAEGDWKNDWVTYVRSYHIPDFSKWKHPRLFRPEFDKLVEALKKPARR